MIDTARRTPWWAWTLITVLAAIQPALLLWIAHWPPDGLVPTGLPIADSALFLHAMRMADRGWTSLYATCSTVFGAESLAYYSVPHLWIYAAMGFAARILCIPDLAAYGAANGLAAFLFLHAAYRLLASFVPRLAARSFILFALGGGLGGVAYVLSGMFGWHAAPGFEDLFRRFAVYELFEGPHLLPSLLFPRCYYTLSLALCFFALTRLAVTRQSAWPIAPLMAVGSFVDLRYGAFATGIALLGVFVCDAKERTAFLRRWVLFPLGLVAGGIPAVWLMRQNPAVVRNHFDGTNMAMWLSPFIATAFFHLLLLPGPIRSHVRDMPPFARMVSRGAIGYLAAFALLFAIYQVYYGNVLVARDAAVAAAISDFALAGLAAGLFLPLFRSGITRAVEHDETPSCSTSRLQPSTFQSSSPASSTGKIGEQWLALWLLACLPLALAAFGSGWFLRYGPQRLEVFLWLPLCAMSAAALLRMKLRAPRIAYTGLMIGCGLCSMAVSTLFFQGPMDLRPGKSPYAAHHSEVMTKADEALIEAIGPGIVLAPIPASDIVALRKGNRVVFGTGSFNLSDQPYVPLEAAVKAFFSPEACDDDRRAFVNAWCVDYIYCPDTWPIAPEVVRQLDNATWIEKVAQQGRGAVFRIPRHHFVIAFSGMFF
ncbi:MAG TPA: hypothetical protein P5318_11080 [Candidatus Hydrogenedentes bacterium]|nr:hypothetical protein [Candidatus Hydrogenedentota bacterium]HRT20657.1 hypothetical protein [Candidatus Hydrogenedentota bacterium]HRT65692.1 hypothetical protein [Candidatus Hydrogenedentota bacterium]